MFVIEVLAASSSTNFRFGFGLQEKVALSQASTLVRPDLEVPLPSDQIQIRMPSPSATGLKPRWQISAPVREDLKV